MTFLTRSFPPLIIIITTLLLLLLLVFPAAVRTLDFRYHSNREMEQFLLQVNASNPDIAHLYSIGRSTRGQQLWVLALGVRPHQHTVGIPEFKYVANMHGNEVLGRVLLLQLVDDLIHGYRTNQSWSQQLLNSTRIHVMPTMNPDGFDSSDTECLYGRGRHNANGVDLNRNFPDAFVGVKAQQAMSEEKREAETRAVIGWLRKETFVLSANLHGGALVASYPYDNSNGGQELVGGASVTPDADVFVHLSKTYSLNHATMHRGDVCNEGRPFLHGVTNGYQWYPLSGGMQDYNYVWAQCLEVTLEISCCKFPPRRELPGLWKENRKSLLTFIQQVHLGVKGRVLDGSGTPVQDAVVEVKGRDNLCPFKTNRHGEYYRLLLPGTHSFTVTYPGHEVLTETLNVPYGPDTFSAMRHDFWLRRDLTASNNNSSSISISISAPTANASNYICNQTFDQQGACGAAWAVTWSAATAALGLVVALLHASD